MVQLSISFNDGQQQKEFFNALCENAQVTRPLQETFWGAPFGMLTDKFGCLILINLAQNKKSIEIDVYIY